MASKCLSWQGCRTRGSGKASSWPGFPRTRKDQVRPAVTGVVFKTSITSSVEGCLLQPFFRYSNKRRGIDTDFNNGRRAIRGRTGEPACSEVGEHRVNILRKRDLDRSAVRRRFHQCRFKSQQVLESRNRKRIGIHESAESDYFVGGKSDRRCDRYVAVKKIAQRLLANSDQEQACCVFEEFRNQIGRGSCRERV